MADLKLNYKRLMIKLYKKARFMCKYTPAFGRRQDRQQEQTLTHTTSQHHKLHNILGNHTTYWPARQYSNKCHSIVQLL